MRLRYFLVRTGYATCGVIFSLLSRPQRSQHTCSPWSCCNHHRAPPPAAFLRYFVVPPRNVVFVLPQRVLSAKRCRVDYWRINAGVVALGESLRPIAAGMPHDPNYLRSNATTQFLNRNKHQLLRNGAADPSPSARLQPFSDMS